MDEQKKPVEGVEEEVQTDVPEVESEEDEDEQEDEEVVQ